MEMDYSFFFPAALILAQRAFAIAESLALAAVLIFRLCFLAGALATGFASLIFAHRALAAAAILARLAALILRFLDTLGAGVGVDPPRIEASSWVNDSIVPLISTARFNTTTLIEDKSIVIVKRL
jgi:hypothetical protein